MGPNLAVAAAPALKRLIEAAARSVPQAGGNPGETAYEAWLGDRDHVPFGDLGGGSDHIGFYCHLGIPSCGLSAGGGKGVSYHSNYDTLAWYRQVVGDDYEPALMLTRLTNLIAARLADTPLLPLDLTQLAPDIRSHIKTLRDRARSLDFDADLAALEQSADTFEDLAKPWQRRLEEAAAAGHLDAATLLEINQALLSIRRFWLHEQGLPQRPWYRNIFAATDPNSGYAAWMLPGMRYYIEARDPTGLQAAQRRCVTALDATRHMMESIGGR
jgi:N-acetylated-alpha-linked acidic dipeptidase